MANNRRKGHNAERYYRTFFESFFGYCKTSRQASQLLDDCKVDLFGIPVNVQIKAGKQRGLNPSLVLREMKEKLSKHFPRYLKHPSIIIHKKDVGRGKKRTEYDELVTMSFEDFKKLLNMAYDRK